MVIVVVNGSKNLCFYMLFIFFIFFEGDLVTYFFYQKIYLSGNAPLTNDIFIEYIIENILHFLISNLLFSLQ